MDKRDLLEGQKRPTTGARRGTRYRQHRSGQYLALRPDAAEEERVEEVHAHAILRHQFACVIHAGRWSARRPPAHAPAPSTPRPLSSIPVPSKAWEWGAMAPAKPRRARLRRLPRRLPVYRVDPFPLRPYRCTQPCLQLHPHQPHSLATVLLWRARHFDDPGTSAFSPHNSGMTDSNGQNASVPQHCICTSAFHPFPPLAHRPFWFVSV